MREKTLNRFLAGAQLDSLQPVKMYGKDRLQIWLQNGAFLSISVADNADLEIDLLGPDPPERVLLREMWEDS